MALAGASFFSRGEKIDSSEVNIARFSAGHNSRPDEAVLYAATYGLSAEQDALVKTIFGVLETRTRIPWTFSALGQAQAVIMTDTALARPEGRRALGDRLPIVLCADAATAAKSTHVCLPGHISVMNLLVALDDVSQGITPVNRHVQEDKIAAAVTPAPASRVVASTADRSSLASTIARLATESSHRRVRARITGFGDLDISFAEKLYRIDFSRPQLARAVRERRYVLTAVSEKSVDAEHPQVSGALSDLLWVAGLAPCVDFRIGDEERVSLVRWPNLPRLPHLLEHVQLCGLLNGRVMTPLELAGESGLAIEVVRMFLGACVLSGYAQRHTAPAGLFESTPAPRAMARGGLLDRLLKHLGFARS
jgi:hypothetical protein